MFTFDEKTKFLILSKKPLDPVIDRYTQSDQYRSYNKYLQYGLKEDISTVLIPALNKLLKDYDIEFAIDDSSISVKKDVSYIKHTTNVVKLSLTQLSAINLFKNDAGRTEYEYRDKKLNSFNLLSLPFMDESGILYNEGKTNVIINSLSLDNALTFDGSKLKFVDSGHSLIFSGVSKPKVTLFNNSITVVELLIMLAKNQFGVTNGIEYSYRFIKSIRNNILMNSISGTETDYQVLGEDALDSVLSTLVNAVNEQRALEFGLVDKLEKGYLNTVETRRSLNDMLSFNNAIGRTVSQDIVNSDGKIIVRADEVVTKLVISTLHNNFIDTIYVRKSINLVGQYIATSIFLGNTIVRGTPIIPQMIELIPALENYQVAPDTYTIPNGDVLVISKNTVITNELCSCLEYLGVSYISYKEKIKSKKVLKAYFEEEYINNRHFPIMDLDINDPDNYDYYAYVTEDGTILPESEELTCYDIAAMLSLYMKLISGDHYQLMSDPDSGLRKKVDQASDHFHKAFLYATNSFIKKGGPGLVRLVKSNSADLNSTDRMNVVFNYFTKDFMGCIRRVLKVLDVLDITNPVSTLSSLTKINTIVKNDDSVSDSMRRLTMGHYGRICPYETPQSKKLGVVNNTAMSCKIEDGVMYTSYLKLNNNNGKITIDPTIVWMTVVDEEKVRIGDIAYIDIDMDTLEVSAKGRIPARVPSLNSLEKITFVSIRLQDVQYVNSSLNQHQSYACSTIPYTGADDAARVSFEMSMVKQAKGLVNGEIPIICTSGFLNIPNKNTYYKVFAEGNGRVDVVTSTVIVIRYDGNTTPKSYSYEPMTMSSESLIVRVAEVVVGDRVTKGQTIVSSNYVKDGILVLGVNALTGLMTDGYNHEDGFGLSTRITDKLTSYGVHTDVMPVSKKSNNVNISDVMYDNYLDKDDKLCTKIERVGSINNYSKIQMRASNCRGFIANAEAIRDRDNNSKIKGISVRSVSYDQLNESDKLCNRHGNKGVSCKVYKNSEMMYLENGEILDVKVNLNGIITRMNVGQILEGTSGLACHVLGIRCLMDSFNSPKNEEIKMLLSYAVDLANSTDEENIFLQYPELPKELHDHCRNNIQNIRHWANTFNKEGKAYLIDPKSGKRTLNKITIGVNYMYKLVQEGESKMHSRGGFLTSQYVDKTESPTKGAANGGGQRHGYMEFDALAAYGCSALLHEITNERSDNYIARNNVTVDAVHSGNPAYKLDEKYGIRRSTEYMLELFKGLGLHVEMTENELDLVNVQERKYHTRSSIINAVFDGDEKEKDIEDLMFEAFKNLGK